MMTNACTFSPCRRYRYTLEHVMDPLLPPRRVMWIGLNPSTADEQQLDPTLRRIRGFSQAWGFTAFVMTNVFAYRATRPEDMKAQKDPVGVDNDLWLERMAGDCEVVVAAWGKHGAHAGRAEDVVKKLSSLPRPGLLCLGTNGDGSPKHPLYVAGATVLVPFRNV